MAGYNEDVNINLNILAGAMGGITAIAGGMSALTSTFGQFGTTAVDAFGDVDGLLVSASALIAAFGVEAANAYGEFEQGMKIVQAVSGQTSGAIAQLSEQANQLSVSYRTAIGDITEGLQTLGRAGLNSADAQLEVLESGLQTAKLEGRNLNGVLEELIQNTAMLGGNLDAIDFGAQTEYVNSLMVGTSMSAPIDTHDISQTLQYVGGTAAAAGANLEDKEKLEDLMGTIAAFAQKGVTGSMAGTALRAFLTKPASQDHSVTEGLGAIGLSPEDLWEDGGESMKDISEQIGLIQRQMDKLNLSTMDQLEIWGKIVGPKMGQQMMKLESDKIKDLTADIQEASSAEQLASSTLNTYNQKVAEMGEIGSGIFRQLGSNIVMWLNPVLEVINKILSLFNNPGGGLLLFGGTIAVVSRGLRAAYGMITSIVGQIRAAFTEIRTALSNIGGSQEGVVSGASRYDSIIKQAAADIKIMNSNLMETDTLWGSFQAAALGKQATQQIRGYSSDNPMDQGLLGVSDDYRQYFRKPIVAPDSYGIYLLRDYDKDGDSPREGLTKKEYDNLPKSDKKFFEEHSQTGLYHPRGPGGFGSISQADYNKMTSETKSMFFEREVPYDRLQDVPKQELEKYYRKLGEEHIRNLEEVYNHKYPGQYQSLSSEDKKKYGSREFRIEDRVGTIDEMEKQIKESSGKLQIVSKEEWKKASEAERKAIQRATANFREDMENQARRSQEVITTTGPDGKKYDTGMRYYQTYSNIPKAEDLAELTKRDKKNWAQKMVEAQGAEDFAAARKAARSNMSRRDQVRFDGLESLRRSADNTSSVFSRLGNVVSGSGQKVNVEGKAVQSRFQQLRTSIGNGISSLATLTNGFTLSSSRITELEQATLRLTEGKGTEMLTSSTLNGKFSEMAAKLGLTEQEFAELVLASQQVENAFQRVSGASVDDIGGVAGKKITGKFGKLSGALSSVVGMLGGPFSAAMMGATLAVQAVQMAFQSYQKELQQAQKELSEANSKRQEIEGNIKELYSSENDQLTEADLNRALDAQYATIGNYQTGDSLSEYGSAYVPGDVYFKVGKGEDITSRVGDEHFVDEFELSSDENVKALNENTVQLAAATAEYARAAQKVGDKLTDPIFGSFSDDNALVGGLITKLTGGRAGGPGTILSDGWANLAQVFTTGKIRQDNFLQGKGPALFASQKSDDYAGSKELAPIIAADSVRLGSQNGIKNALGSSMDTIKQTLGGIESNTYQALMTHGQNFAGMDAETAGISQVLWKEKKEDFQQIGKLMAKWEHLRGGIDNSTMSPLLNGKIAGSGGLKIKPRYTAYDAAMQRNQNKQKGKGKEDKIENKQLNELKQIERTMDNKIAQLIRDSNGKLSVANVLAMSQLQQFQDMYDVANSTIAPGVMSTVEQAYNNVVATQGVGGVTGTAAGGAVTAGENAGIIAAFLTRQAIDKAGSIMYKDQLAKGDWKAIAASMLGGEDTYKGLVANNPSFFGVGLFDKEQALWGKTMASINAEITNPGQPADFYNTVADKNWAQAQEEMKKNGTGFRAALATINRPLQNHLTGAVQAAYLNSSVGEGGSRGGGSGSGGGGGDGGSGGSGDSDKGNKKNRVDLVLCNKKEIPKLNVNLFKKEPNFTVLNKNFKLRDIKINTKDTPKSILTAVKNGLIDTAKRMDPKIIQDEEGEYDPTGATEGKDTPSGTTPSSSE